MIETYWKEMFSGHSKEDGIYDIPNLPEPLMSANFKTRNIVGREIVSARMSFLLCTFKGNFHYKSRNSIMREPLSRSLESDDFWRFQKEQQPEAFDFISRLLPFLCDIAGESHDHFWIADEHGISASVVVGKSNSCGFIFNGLVRRDCRGQGLARDLHLSARCALAEIPSFYWTKHSYLTLGADNVSTYHLV